MSPPPTNGYSKTTVVTQTETVSVVPGDNGAPRLPKGANGSYESFEGIEGRPTEVEFMKGRKSDASFQWPDDVF